MKKLIVIFLVLFFSTTIEEANGQQLDTIFTYSGGKILCKVLRMNEFNIKYEGYSMENGTQVTYIKKINGDKVKRVGLYAANKINTEPVTYVSQYKPESMRQDTRASEAIDTLKYLMSDNAYLRRKISDQAMVLGDMSNAIQIGGNRIRNAGYFSIGAIATGVLSGVFLYLASDAAATTPKPGYTSNSTQLSQTYTTLGVAAGVITLICTIAVPIELIGAGNKMK